MKGCFKFVLILFALLCAASFGRYYLLLTPEQRAAEAAQFQAAQKAEADAAERRREEDRTDRARIESLKPGFLTWLVENTGVTKASFQAASNNVIEVEFDRVFSSKDEARVKAEALARAWRLRSGLDYAKCSIFWGNEVYATGVSR